MGTDPFIVLCDLLDSPRFSWERRADTFLTQDGDISIAVEKAGLVVQQNGKDVNFWEQKDLQEDQIKALHKLYDGRTQESVRKKAEKVLSILQKDDEDDENGDQKKRPFVTNEELISELAGASESDPDLWAETNMGGRDR